MIPFFTFSFVKIIAVDVDDTANAQRLTLTFFWPVKRQVINNQNDQMSMANFKVTFIVSNCQRRNATSKRNLK